MEKKKTIKVPVKRLQDKPEFKKMAPHEVYITIVEWLYQNDGHYTTKNEWRTALLGHMQRLFRQM